MINSAGQHVGGAEAAESAERGSASDSSVRPDARQRRFITLWALLILPLFLGVVAVAASETHLRFLLFPPLAAIGLALFRDPYSQRTAFRSVVMGPVAGALIGVAALRWMPVGPVRIALVTAIGIGALSLLRAELTPALAVSLLSLLVGAEGMSFVISIALSSCALWLLFLLWRRLIYARHFPPVTQEVASCSWAQLRRLL